jgi:20S proteasome alpha/beta subunit
MKQPRIYVRPDPDLPKEEAINQVVDALTNFFADQLESDGKLEQALRFREKIGGESKPDNDREG